MSEEAMNTAEVNNKWEMASKVRMRQMIVSDLFLGNVRASFNRDMLQQNNIKAIVSLTSSRWAKWNKTPGDVGIPKYRHKWVQCTDSSTQDLLAHMSDICDFIDQMASPALSSLSSLPVDYNPTTTDELYGAPSEAILIHCDLGVSRSPTIIIACLMRKLHIQQVDALTFAKTKQPKPRVKPSSNFTRQLQVWEEVGYQIWEDEDRAIPKAPYKAFMEDRAALLENPGLTCNEPLAPLSLSS
jgi:dual specificity phosphatase 12